MPKSLRCTLGLHAWRTEHNEDGEAYQACSRCPAERERVAIVDHPGSGGGSLYL